MNDQQIEKEIVEKGKTAPRVTPDHIEGIIAQEAYFTAEDGAFGKAIKAKHTGGEVNYAFATGDDQPLPDDESGLPRKYKHAVGYQLLLRMLPEAAPRAVNRLH